jgi:hypothetical protein
MDHCHGCRRPLGRRAGGAVPLCPLCRVVQALMQGRSGMRSLAYLTDEELGRAAGALIWDCPDPAEGYVPAEGYDVGAQRLARVAARRELLERGRAARQASIRR